MNADYEHGFTFSVSDVRIHGFNIGGVLLAAKRGDKRALLLFNALATFLGEVKEMWIDQWGEGGLLEFQSQMQTIEQGFFDKPTDIEGEEK